MDNEQLGQRRFDLPASARAVIRALYAHGPATRPRLVRDLGLSKPTMSAAMLELVRLDLVQEQGETWGDEGRRAVEYSAAPTTGHVIGIELGATVVRVAAHRLDGHRLAVKEQLLPAGGRVVTPGGARAAAALLADLRRELGATNGPLLDVVVAAPTLPALEGTAGRRIDGVDHFAGLLGLEDQAAWTLENNVNCAAVAEHRLGVARGRDTFCYLQVGVKIGAGVILGGRLLAGARGGAGEVAVLPFPWDGRTAPRPAALEHHLGSDSMMQRCAAGWPDSDGPPPLDPPALFEAARAGVRQALRVVDEHARDIGRMVVAVMAVIDPGLVVLGGGVGQNQLLLPLVRSTVRELAWDTEIMTTAMGEQATLLGAVHLAAERCLARMFG